MKNILQIIFISSIMLPLLVHHYLTPDTLLRPLQRFRSAITGR